MRGYSFRVEGTPVAQGSLKRSGAKAGRRLYHANQKTLAPWRERIADAARAQRGDAPLIDESTEVSATFLVPRPRNHYHVDGRLRDAPIFAAKRPDLDKYVRALLDALTGSLIADDSRVVRLRASKEYATDEPTGVVVVVSTL